MLFRNLCTGTVVWPQEETPESLSYPLPQFLCYIYLPSWISFYLPQPKQLGLPPSPAAPRKVGETPSPLGPMRMSGDGGVTAWLSGETHVGF